MVPRNELGRQHLPRRKGSIVNNEQNSIACALLDNVSCNVKGAYDRHGLSCGAVHFTVGQKLRQVRRIAAKPPRVPQRWNVYSNSPSFTSAAVTLDNEVMQEEIARDVLIPVNGPREQKRPGARLKRLAANAEERQGARYRHAE